jgi:hypothetical protein
MPLAVLTDYDIQETIPADGAPAVQACLDAAEEWFLTAIGHEIESSTYTQRLTGDGTPILFTPQWPITAVSSLIVDEDTWSVLTSESTTDSDEECFLPHHGRWIEGRDVTFPSSPTIVMTYTAGYATVPADVTLCVVMMARLLVRERQRLGEGAKTLGPENVQQVVRDLKEYPLIEATIRRYSQR